MAVVLASIQSRDGARQVGAEPGTRGGEGTLLISHAEGHETFTSHPYKTSMEDAGGLHRTRLSISE